MKGAVYINRDNGGDRSTVAVLHYNAKSARGETRAIAKRVALEACQRCNGGVQFYVSQRPCRDVSGPVESARFVASMLESRKKRESENA